MSVAYNKFLPEVLPYVPTCPEIAATSAIRNACIEFCDRSHWLLFEHDPIDVVAGDSHYAFDLPDDTVVARVQDVWFRGQLMAPIGEDDLKTMYAGVDWRQVTGDPAFYTHLDPDELILSPVPFKDDPDGLNLIVVLRPSRDSTTVDQSVYERHAETIGFGARARLHEVKGQPYYDPALATQCRVMFERGINMATIERERGLTRHVLRVQFRPVV